MSDVRDAVRMTRRSAVVLRASAIWAVWVWAVLIRNMLTDHSAGWSFRAVHIGLAVVSIAFAVATLAIARAGRRADRGRHEPARTGDGATP